LKAFPFLAGISYLSRAQELVAKVRMGNPTAVHEVIKPSSNPLSVADSVFVDRVKLRVKHWKKTCSDSSSRKTEGERCCIIFGYLVYFPYFLFLSMFTSFCRGSYKIAEKTCLRG